MNAGVLAGAAVTRKLLIRYVQDSANIPIDKETTLHVGMFRDVIIIPIISYEVRNDFYSKNCTRPPVESLF